MSILHMFTCSWILLFSFFFLFLFLFFFFFFTKLFSSLCAFVRITLYLVVFLRQNRVAFYIQHLRDEWEEEQAQRSALNNVGDGNNQKVTTSVEKSILILKKLRENNSLRGAQ